MLLGLDYAGGRPNPSAITAGGFSFACRYLTSGGPGLPGKLLTPAEYTALGAAGVAVVPNWETTANRMLGGHDAGVTDAQTANAYLTKLGHPAVRPVFFSADFDATPAQQAEIDDYLRGCASVLGPDRVGVYGSYYVVSRCLDNHTAVWAWQTMAWSGGQVDPRAHIVQRIATAVVGGVECDVNEARILPDYGQHPIPHQHRRSEMTQLPATKRPDDPNSDPATWDQTNYDVDFAPDQGFQCVFGVEEWGGRTADTARGFLRMASWILADNTLTPVSPELSSTGKGVVIFDHAPTSLFTAPAGAKGLTLNYAAPGGAAIGT
jgi:hypothetical protein